MTSKQAGLKRTRCGVALSTRLGAVRRQLGREHLHLAVLGNLRAGFPRYTRLLFVRAPTRRRARRPSWAFQKQRHGASYVLAWRAAPGRVSAVPTRLLKADPKDCRIEYAHCHAVLKRMLQCSHCQPAQSAQHSAHGVGRAAARGAAPDRDVMIVIDVDDLGCLLKERKQGGAQSIENTVYLFTT